VGNNQLLPFGSSTASFSAAVLPPTSSSAWLSVHWRLAQDQSTLARPGRRPCPNFFSLRRSWPQIVSNRHFSGPWPKRRPDPAFVGKVPSPISSEPSQGIGPVEQWPKKSGVFLIIDRIPPRIIHQRQAESFGRAEQASEHTRSCICCGFRCSGTAWGWWGRMARWTPASQWQELQFCFLPRNKVCQPAHFFFIFFFFFICGQRVLVGSCRKASNFRTESNYKNPAETPFILDQALCTNGPPPPPPPPPVHAAVRLFAAVAARVLRR